MATPPNSDGTAISDERSSDSAVAAVAATPGGGIDAFYGNDFSNDSSPAPAPAKDVSNASSSAIDSITGKLVLPKTSVGDAPAVAPGPKGASGASIIGGRLETSAMSAAAAAVANAQRDRPGGANGNKVTNSGSAFEQGMKKPGGGGGGAEGKTNDAPKPEQPSPPMGDTTSGGGGAEGTRRDAPTQPKPGGDTTGGGNVTRNPDGGLNKVVDAKGNETNFLRNKDGKVTMTTDKNGDPKEVAHQVRDANGNVTSEQLKDAAGNRVDYDKYGNIKITAKDGTVTHSRVDGSVDKTGKDGVTRTLEGPVAATPVGQTGKIIGSQKPNDVGQGTKGDGSQSNKGDSGASNAAAAGDGKNSKDGARPDGKSNHGDKTNDSDKGDKSGSLSAAKDKIDGLMKRLESLVPTKPATDSSSENAKPPSVDTNKQLQQIPVVTELKPPVPKPSK